MEEAIMQGQLERNLEIKEMNRRKRLDFVKSHARLSDEFWKAVFFSDELKFNVF